MEEIFYEPESFWEVLSNYAALKQKSLMYFTASGIRQSTNDQKVEEALSHYSSVCPAEIVDRLKVSEHNVLFFEDEYAARVKCEEWFPFIGEMDDREYDVYVHIFSKEGYSIFENMPMVK